MLHDWSLSVIVTTWWEVAGVVVEFARSRAVVEAPIIEGGKDAVVLVHPFVDIDMHERVG